MANRRIKTPADSLITLPCEVLPLLKTASVSELRTLVYFFGCPDAKSSDAARELSLTVSQVESACAFWRGAGIFVDGAECAKPLNDAGIFRNYDSETISNAISNDTEYADLCALAADKLGKQLTKNDYGTLLFLYDYVRMPAPVICGVIEHCCRRDKKSLQYIYKKVVGLFEDGIDTYVKFEQYLARCEAVESDIGRLRRLCGMGERALTPKEEKLFDTWFGEWAIPFELVRLAYEKTVDGTGKLSFTYMNAILRRWHESGFTSAEDVKKGEAGRESGVQSSFGGDEFIEAALKRGFND